jgi:hypothetical protein
MLHIMVLQCQAHLGGIQGILGPSNEPDNACYRAMVVWWGGLGPSGAVTLLIVGWACAAAAAVVY